MTIPTTITEIGRASFNSCSNLTEVNYNAIDASKSNFYNGQNKVSPPFMDSNENLIINIGNDVKILPNHLFMSSNVKQVNIEEGLEKIGKQTFDGCINLTSVTIPTTVTEIGRYSFDSCSNLTEINYNAIDASESKFTYWDSEYRRNKSSITILGSK